MPSPSCAKDETRLSRLTQRDVGRIESISTGIAKVSGLPGVGFEEVLKFPGGVYGIAFNVDEAELGSSCWGLLQIACRR